MKLSNEIERCFPLIEEYFSEHELKIFRECSYADLSKYHMGIGVRIRNDILIKSSSLLQSFINHGVFHKDDMSAIILLYFYFDQKEKYHRQL